MIGHTPLPKQTPVCRPLLYSPTPPPTWILGKECTCLLCGPRVLVRPKPFSNPPSKPFDPKPATNAKPYSRNLRVRELVRPLAECCPHIEERLALPVGYCRLRVLLMGFRERSSKAWDDILECSTAGCFGLGFEVLGYLRSMFKAAKTSRNLGRQPPRILHEATRLYVC